MSVATSAPEPCRNLNHRRSDAPVRHCPDCGGVVNQHFHTSRCSDIEHDTARRRRLAFCVHCGSPLIRGR
jgi:hypothetical protein